MEQILFDNQTQKPPMLVLTADSMRIKKFSQPAHRADSCLDFLLLLRCLNHAANCVCFNVSVSVKSTGASGSPCKVNIGKTSSIVRAGVLKPRSGKGRYTTKDGIPVRESHYGWRPALLPAWLQRRAPEKTKTGDPADPRDCNTAAFHCSPHTP